MSSQHIFCQLTIPLGTNGPFTMRTNAGFSGFLSRASHYLKEFKNFAGASHVILDESNYDAAPPPPDDTVEGATCKTRETSDTLRTPFPSSGKTREQSPHKMREQSSQKMREHTCIPCTIPHDDFDFFPLKAKPAVEDFATTNSTTIANDPEMDVVCRKQFQLPYTNAWAILVIPFYV